MSTVRGWLVPMSDRRVVIPELLPRREPRRAGAPLRVRFRRLHAAVASVSAAYVPPPPPAIGLLVDVYG